MNNNRIFGLKNLCLFIILVGGFCYFFKNFFIPYIWYDNNEVEIRSGNIIIALRELKIYKPDKIIKYHLKKANRFSEDTSNLNFKLNYSDEKIDTIQKYYTDRAQINEWIITKNTPENIQLVKNKDNYKIFLNFKNEKNGIWELTAYCLNN